MTTHKELIASALRQRLKDVRGRMFALGVEAVNIRIEVPETWKTSSSGCLVSLRQLIAGEEVSVAESEPEPHDVVLERLKLLARDSSRRYEVLIQRYSYPLSFLSGSEESIREHLLERSMVQDRAVIERSSVDSINANELLLRLNLLSLYAAVTSDLRYLDALNYYFELLPEHLNLDSQQKDLYAIFLSLYERALKLTNVN